MSRTGQWASPSDDCCSRLLDNPRGEPGRGRASHPVAIRSDWGVTSFDRQYTAARRRIATPMLRGLVRRAKLSGTRYGGRPSGDSRELAQAMGEGRADWKGDNPSGIHQLRVLDISHPEELGGAGQPAFPPVIQRRPRTVGTVAFTQAEPQAPGSRRPRRPDSSRPPNAGQQPRRALRADGCMPLLAAPPPASLTIGCVRDFGCGAGVP